jgi:hypothetical protein
MGVVVVSTVLILIVMVIGLAVSVVSEAGRHNRRCCGFGSITATVVGGTRAMLAASNYLYL